jgi:dihydrofolate reductase
VKNKDYPRVSAIAAMSENNVIGKDNKLPWHMPADLKHFKTLTTGHAILMGRKTYESIGRPLPNRLNIVLTGNPHFEAQGCVVVRSLDAGLEIAAEQENEEVFIIGGAEVYRQLLPKIERLYLTVIHHVFDGDAHFPTLNTQEWREISNDKHQPDEQNAFAYSFVTLERI